MKKSFLAVVLIIILWFCLTACGEVYEPAPKITEGEFPFVVEYEMNGEVFLIEDTVLCTYEGYDMSNNFAIFGYPYSRMWRASLKSGDESKRLIVEFEPDTESVLVEGRKNIESRIIIYYGSGGYYMGDPHERSGGPYINYVERYKYYNDGSKYEYTALTKEQLEKYFGIRLIKFEFSEPIENIFE